MSASASSRGTTSTPSRPRRDCRRGRRGRRSAPSGSGRGRSRRRGRSTGSAGRRRCPRGRLRSSGRRGSAPRRAADSPTRRRRRCSPRAPFPTPRSLRYGPQRRHAARPCGTSRRRVRSAPAACVCHVRRLSTGGGGSLTLRKAPEIADCGTCEPVLRGCGILRRVVGPTRHARRLGGHPGAHLRAARGRRGGAARPDLACGPRLGGDPGRPRGRARDVALPARRQGLGYADRGAGSRPGVRRLRAARRAPAARRLRRRYDRQLVVSLHQPAGRVAARLHVGGMDRRSGALREGAPCGRPGTRARARSRDQPDRREVHLRVPDDPSRRADRLGARRVRPRRP